jgi:hypothetical protein
VIVQILIAQRQAEDALAIVPATPWLTDIFSPRHQGTFLCCVDRGDPSPSMQAFEDCAGWSGTEPHA